jgi:transposase
MAPQQLSKGVGAYSAAVLQYELRGFERFKNRRQVASYTGLCPGIHPGFDRSRSGRDARAWHALIHLPFKAGPMTNRP